MKKEEITSLIIYMFIIAIALVYSLTILRTHYDYSAVGSPIAYAGLIILSLIAGVVSTALLIEFGHMIGAKIGKYEITSVCILYFTFYKDETKWKFKFGSFDGLTGETKIAPKHDKAKPTAYLWFPTLLLAIWAIGCFVIFAMYNTKVARQSDLAYFFLTIMVVVLICLVYNILPLKLDSKTDGFGLRMMADQKNKTAFNEMLTVDKAVSDGQEVNIETISEKELTNYTAQLNLNKVLLLIDKKEYAEAEKILDIILAADKKLANRIILYTVALKIYAKTMTSSLEEMKEFLAENLPMTLRRELSEDGSFVCIRAYILVEAISDESKSECMYAINKVNSAYKHTDKGRKKAEAILYNETIDYVIKIHPKWDLGQYKIDEELLK